MPKTYLYYTTFSRRSKQKKGEREEGKTGGRRTALPLPPTGCKWGGGPRLFSSGAPPRPGAAATVRTGLSIGVNTPVGAGRLFRGTAGTLLTEERSAPCGRKLRW